jgi:hypothetical protein
MANDDKSGTNLANGSVIFVAIVATGTYFFHRKAPLLDSRPAVAEASISEPRAAQTIDARLWQDPFAAVAKALGKLRTGEVEQQCAKKPSDDDVCKFPLKQMTDKTLVLGVTLSGAPYSEDAEQRRRTRYAVLAGLERAGFVPRDARHIEYFLWTQSRRVDAPASIALEIPFFASPRPLQPVILQQAWPDCSEPIISAATQSTVV